MNQAGNIHSSYLSSTTGFTTLSDAYTSKYATTPQGGLLTSMVYNELKADPTMSQHLKSIPPDKNRRKGSRALRTVTLNVDPTKRGQLGGYVYLSDMSEIVPRY